MVLTDEGAVLSFGGDVDGQLGHGDVSEDQLEPKVIDELSGRRVTAIAAGSGHSMVMTDESDGAERGVVLSFGHNGFGQLGGRDFDSETVSYPVRTPTQAPGRRHYRVPYLMDDES